MVKKLLFGFLILIFLIVSYSIYSAYRTNKINEEKCGHLTKKHGYEFVWHKNHCVAKKALEDQGDYKQQRIEEVGYEGYIEERKMAVYDNIRVGDINTITEWLKEYHLKYDKYPKELSWLNRLKDYEKRFLYGSKTEIKREKPYIYATKTNSNGEIVGVHIGASLEESLPDDGARDLEEDDDFNSKAAEWSNGFNGDDSQPCHPDDVGKYCYDIKLGE